MNTSKEIVSLSVSQLDYKFHAKIVSVGNPKMYQFLFVCVRSNYKYPLRECAARNPSIKKKQKKFSFY